MSRTSKPDTQAGDKSILAAVEVFLADKRVEDLSADLVKKYERELARFTTSCEGSEPKR